MTERQAMILETIKAVLWAWVPSCMLALYSVTWMPALIQSGRIEGAISLGLILVVAAFAGTMAGAYMLRDLWGRR